MKIKQIEVLVTKIPRVEPKSDMKKRQITDAYYVLDRPLSVVYSNNIETVYVKITTDEGIVGWGEILAPTSPEVAAVIIKTALAPVLVGENPLQNQVLWDKMLNMFRVRGYTGGFLLDAMTGLDIALWDIKGKYLNQPLYMLMGGKYRTKIPVYISSIAGSTVEERMESIASLFADGNKAIKLHTVGESWRDALEMLETIRSKYNPEQLKVSHDAHWNYTLGEARKFGIYMDELDMEFFECPLSPEDLYGHVKLAEGMNTPIALGESMRSLYTFNEWVKAGAVEVLQPDMGRCGITDMLRIATIAEANGLKVAPHLSVHQNVGFAATVHYSAAIPNLHSFEYQPVAINVANEYSNCGVKLENGCINISDAPGLGIDMDESVLSKYVTEHIKIN